MDFVSQQTENIWIANPISALLDPNTVIKDKMCMIVIAILGIKLKDINGTQSPIIKASIYKCVTSLFMGDFDLMAK